LELYVIIIIAIGLAMDAFAVAIGSGVVIGKITGRQIFRLGFHFGLFQAFMPVLGWLAGRTVHTYIERWDHWIAFGLLSLIGGKAIYSALNENNENEFDKHDPSKGVSLILLSVATSIDAFAVGLSFAVLSVSIWYPCLIIGVITSALTILGMFLGSRLGAKFGRKMETVGGLVLILIGFKILFEHLF
jgi:manganese efflux pump family protein